MILCELWKAIHQMSALSHRLVFELDRHLLVRKSIGPSLLNSVRKLFKIG